MTEKTIPLLTCPAIAPVAEFYTALGFAVTFEQHSPYAYLVVERGTVELQFFGMKNFDPAASLGGCYILTDEVDALHEIFRAGLKETYGKVPTRGIPRIGPLKDMAYGVRQFLMTDPGGNSIRVGQPTGGDGHIEPAPKDTFERALHFAALFADSKEDLPAAATVLDRVLAPTHPRPTPVQRARLLILRADVAHRAGEDAAAVTRRLDEAAAVPLSDAERATIPDDLARLAELRLSLP
ncbi:bleomycin resistance protein [Streptomyces xiamenensis]|uniref:bleomycin resistance protein n=1 Tax=Streptomyces xiamenensis TaxID=408015 RepID=UPI0036862E68